MSKIKAAIEAAKKRRESGQGQFVTASGALAARTLPQPTGGTAGSLTVASIRHLTVNLANFKANRIVTHDARHPAEAAYRMLRTRLMQKKRTQGWQILGISSLGQDEGKTLTAINLAISVAAEIGQEAVLIDLDLRRPAIYAYLGIDGSEFTSLTQYLDGRVNSLPDLMVCPGIERLGCLLSSEPMAQPSDVLASPRGKRFFEDLRSRLPPETIVIVDLPPLLSTDDALAVAPMIDGLLLVVAEGRANRNDLADARELLKEFNVVGTILNMSVDKDHRSYYYY